MTVAENEPQESPWQAILGLAAMLPMAVIILVVLAVLETTKQCLAGFRKPVG
jgi:hypothetical protein